VKPTSKSPQIWVSLRLHSATARPNQPIVKTKLNHGSSRTKGAWINTGTETRKDAAAKVNQAFCEPIRHRVVDLIAFGGVEAIAVGTGV
jgi:hypothetical protein